MTRPKFEKEIALRSGIKKDVVKEIIKVEEELVFELIASEDSVRYLWGTIGGKDKRPQRVSGGYRLNLKTIANHGWTYYKRGVPFIKWSRIAEETEELPCGEYFNQESVKYTSLARLWRRETHQPEIPEYLDLPEEEIERMCRKADAQLDAKLNANQKKLKQMQYTYNLRQRIASRYFWKATGYTPMGALWHDDLGTYNYVGPQRDKISVLKEAAEKKTDPLAREYLINKANEIQKAVDKAAEEERRQILKANEIEEKIRRERRNLEREVQEIEDRTRFEIRRRIQRGELSKSDFLGEEQKTLYEGDSDITNIDSRIEYINGIYNNDGKNEEDAENMMYALDALDEQRYNEDKGNTWSEIMKKIEEQNTSAFYKKEKDEDFDY